MKFYCITRPEKQKTRILLENICIKLNIEFVNINTETANYLDLRAAIKNNILYRVSDSTDSIQLEKALLTTNVKTFYSNTINGLNMYDNVIEATLLHEKLKLPIAKSLFYINKKTTEVNNINYLGGFPVIIKVAYGQKGIGVIKVDSRASYNSIIDHLQNENTPFIVREFIDSGDTIHSYRSIVLGDNCIFTYKNSSISTKDFRSNVNQHKRDRKQIKLSSIDKAIMVKTVKSLGLEFGAVDFMRNEHGNLKILEVNFPFNFIPIIEDFDFPIDHMLVEYLIKKK